MFPQHDSVLGCDCLAPSKRPDVYPTHTTMVLVGDLGLCGWPSLGGFLTFRVVRVDANDQVQWMDFHQQRAARALPSVLQALAVPALLCLRLLPPQSFAASTPQYGELCHIESYLLLVWGWAFGLVPKQKARRAAKSRVLRLRRRQTESRPVQCTQYRHRRKRLRPYSKHLRHLSRYYRESLVDLHIISRPLLSIGMAGAPASTTTLTFT